ncbi:MAG: hypothetical protein KC502_07550 [Myxococcales bacterium]|nr:hypothetical protein [Myxococcales bacterium]
MKPAIAAKATEIKNHADALKTQADALLTEFVERAESLQSQAIRRAVVTGGALRSDAVVAACDAGAAALTEASRRLDGKEGTDGVVEKLRGWTQSLAKTKDAANTPAIEGYDSLNVRDVVAALPSLSLWQVEQVRRHEEMHKNRVTVLRACNERLQLAA